MDSVSLVHYSLPKLRLARCRCHLVSSVFLLWFSFWDSVVGSCTGSTAEKNDIKVILLEIRVTSFSVFFHLG